MARWIRRVFVAFAVVAMAAPAQPAGKARGKAAGGHKGIMQLADANGDGQIDDAEAEQFAKSRAAQLKKQLATVLERFDTNGDGTLDADEAAKMRNQIAEHGGRDPVHGLKRIDRDGDFKISEEEEAAAVKGFVAQVRQAGKGGDKPARPNGNKGQARRAPQNPDANGDGIVDDQEARAEAERRIEAVRRQLEAFAERKARNPDAKPPRYLAMFDTDEDGQLSGEEANAIVEQLMKEFEARNALVLRIFDDNKNGVLDEVELLIAKKAFLYTDELRQLSNELRRNNQRDGGKPAKRDGKADED